MYLGSQNAGKHHVIISPAYFLIPIQTQKTTGQINKEILTWCLEVRIVHIYCLRRLN